MSKAILEFRKFLSQYQDKFDNNQARIAKLILNNFREVENKSSARGNRAKFIVQLLENETKNDNKIDFNDVVSNKTSTQEIGKLSSLIVENFRGFTKKIEFNLNKPYIFIYGPNGTGKSSLCEALEFSLLNTIYEAQNKRINVKTYIKNAYSKKGQFPILKGIDKQTGEEIEVKASLSDYEFCFIERNRIEGFARVSANSPQNQQQQLAALFGLEDFNNFVRNFNDSIENYIDCEGNNRKKLLELEKKVDGYKKIIVDYPTKKDEQDKKAKAILNEFTGIETILQLKEIINGNQDSKGKIQKNNEDIAKLKILKEKEIPNIKKLEIDLALLKDHISENESLRHDLKNFKDELSFRDLYDLILKNQKYFDNICPACYSELYRNNQLQVPVDPYKNAKVKITEFEKIINIEERVKKLDKEIVIQLQGLKNQITIIANISRSIDSENEKSICLLNEKFNEIQSNSPNLKESVFEIDNYLDEFWEVKRKVEEHNKKVTDSKNQIDLLQESNKKLNDTLEKINNINVSLKYIEDEKVKAETEIKKFKQENSNLIQEVEKEKVIVERNKKYCKAYLEFKEKLEEFNRELPIQLVKDLNENTLSIYNSINKYDNPVDLLNEIKLPVNAGEKIEIKFNEGIEGDALHILSEGHLRCLGLSILLSKNINDNLPIIIFDDVVNAIDDEHRRGIIETILQNDDIKEKQLIITTHGEEFVKELDNNVPKKEYRHKVSRIDFLKFEDNFEISVKLNSSRNYLEVAYNRLQENHYRDCLANCRRALESLLNRLWKKLAKNYNVEVSVQLRTPNGKPDLMGIAQSLKKTINKKTNGEFANISIILDEIIADNNLHRIEWHYLNKGTHDEERDSEFDPIVVKEIYESLNKLDELIMETNQIS